MNPPVTSSNQQSSSGMLRSLQGSIDGATTLSVRKRDGRTAPFDPDRITHVIQKAFMGESNAQSPEDLDFQTHQKITLVAQSVLVRILQGANNQLDVEDIQDAVEQELMRQGHFGVARAFILYRADRMKARTLSKAEISDVKQEESAHRTMVEHSDGSKEPLDPERIRAEVSRCCDGLDFTDPTAISQEVMTMLYDGVKTKEIDKAMIFAARARIEREPNYTYVSARMLLNIVYREALGVTGSDDDLEIAYRKKFADFVHFGAQVGRLDPALLQYDLRQLSAALVIERDLKFQYLGLQTLYDRYFIHHEKRRIETPQYFWMRVAMGLAMNEGAEREKRAIEFYNVLSQMLFVSSTPTLFNAGTCHPQLSSCYLLTVQDDLESIFKLMSDDAKLSKWAGGLGNDWTNVRATGAHIKGTNGESQGIIPFLKVANDTAVAVNQGGKRKGAMCAYLETWHLDIEDFLELRKNTGDERRRTHDMNTANWIPDLFMKRVADQGQWTLFDPSETPDLHHLYGSAFDKKYCEYERMADEGKIRFFKRIPAIDLWRKMLSMLFETGHPWITFKDPSNIRSPQDHAGVVHSSNLCTEILLNTSADETAVCNLGSVNLIAHLKNGALDEDLVRSTVSTAIRMLDNVIDINYYPTPEAKNANMRHRPIGLGIMGFQDALYEIGVSYASDEAVEFADRSMEVISYYAISASVDLAQEKGAYQTYRGSKWSRGLLPIDTIELLQSERGSWVDVDRKSSMDWTSLRKRVQEHGMRNSNTMAIAPTATIANISGVTQSIEPMYKNLFSKSNLSGDFTIVNMYLVEDLKKRDLWDAEMLDDIKYFDGALDEIERVPEDLKRKYLTAFQVEPKWLIECASRRQKWIDMGQSLNLYMAEPSGKKISEMYFLAWQKGLKTTYYMRSLAATQVEKSTQDINRRGMQPRWMKNKSASSDIKTGREDSVAPAAQVPAPLPKACSILDPGCEACQ